ncbi:MAG: histidinol-phosphate aminotransferase family protein [Burkholderiales bacterium]|nr:histidinol-phosphate aminotransferase family protein [Burkholderiales bacterium]
MTLNRRQLFRLAGFTAGTIFMGTSAGISFAKQPEFCPPTKEKPLILSFNENPLGMSEKAKKAMAEAGERASRYPFVQVEELRKALAEYMGGKPDEIMPSHGSAEAIRAAIEAYNVPGKTVLIVPELSYSDGADVAKRNHIPVKYVKMGPNWSIDVERMRKEAAEEAEKHNVIVYFVNPNNPTSTIVDSTLLFDWIKSKPKNTFFVIDEAYAEFVNDPTFKSVSELIKEGYDNLVLLKTFSKIFAMAGLRLGFAYATPEVINKVRDHVAYDVMMNQATVAAALSELKDKEFLAESKASNDESRKILYQALDELKIPYLPSETNFVFIDLKAPLQPFADRMKEEHILVGRPFPPAVEWCRISLGTPAEMRYFVEKLKEFRQKGYV